MSHEESLHCSHLSKTEHLAVAYDQKLEHPLQHTRAAHQGKNWSMARRLGAQNGKVLLVPKINQVESEFTFDTWR